MVLWIRSIEYFIVIYSNMLTVNILLLDSWTKTDCRKKPRRIIRSMHEKRGALFAVCKILDILYLHFWDWDPSIWRPFNTCELWVWPIGTWTIIYLLWTMQVCVLTMFMFFFICNNSSWFISNWCQCHKANDKPARKTKVIYTKKGQKTSKNHTIIHRKIL
jgi:hypothetical protein